MTHTELAALKREMVQLMIAVNGPYFTIGWLESAYIRPNPEDIDEAVVISTIAGLKEKLAADAVEV